jgi:hypothetical protein
MPHGVRHEQFAAQREVPTVDDLLNVPPYRCLVAFD